MAVIHCLCGERIDIGEDAPAAFAAVRTHYDRVHPEPHVPNERIQALVEARSRLPDWDGREQPAGPREVRPLNEGTLGDCLEFFDHIGFADNPAWADCYCVFPQYAGDDWERRTWEENRATRVDLVRNGEQHGYMAYVDGRPAGWCNAGPRRIYPWVTQEPEFACDDADSVGSILCFVVAPSYRRQGIGRMLLDAACEGFRERGLAVAEGYPAASTLSAARAYHGPIEMYLDAGFERVREAAEGRHVIVRKALT